MKSEVISGKIILNIILRKENYVLKKAVLTLFFLILSLFLLASCQDDGEDADNIADGNSPDVEDTADEELFVPSKETIPSGGTSFSDFTYARPDAESLMEQMTAFITSIETSTDVLALNAEAISVKDGYDLFKSMYDLARLRSASDSSDALFSSEMEYFNSTFPEVERKYLQVLSSAATSKHSNRFAECFGFSAMKKYSGAEYVFGGLSELKSKESELIGQYTALMENASMSDASVKEQILEIFIGLLEVRSKIADELGYSSYLEYFYENTDGDYTSKDYERLYNHIADYLIPVYNRLASRVLNSNSLNPVDPHKRNAVLNLLGKALRQMDSDIGNAYSYMIYHGLYDISLATVGRISESRTYYISSERSPFLYATLSGDLTDYTLLLREFAQFYDYYTVGDVKISAELPLAASQTMELLGLLQLKELLTAREYKYLSCMEYQSTMLTIIKSSLYSKFEQAIYSLPYHEVNRESIEDAAQKVIDSMGVNRSSFGGAVDLISPELIYEPFSIGASITSSLVSLEIFFEEVENSGRGLSLFKYLIHRGNDISLGSYIELVGLESPLDGETVKRLADSLHYNVMGAHYFVEGPGTNVAEVQLTPEYHALSKAYL